MLRRLSKYEIEAEIGHGGMATVYRARDTVLDRPVAVKILHPHLRSAAEARVRFAREARSVAKLKHPHILEIHDYSGEDAEECYLVAELLTGPTLKDFVADGPEIPAEIAAAIGVQLASALSAAHAKGIVHRDVKPENVLLHEKRCVKLTDFGIAQMLDVQGFTATGQILGSPGHMAPEQIEGAECDERSDVFGLGTVLYYVASGRAPFVGRNPHQLLHRVMQGEFPDPLRVRPAIGERMRAILLRCLAHDREKRFASAAAVEAELRAYLADVGLGDPDALLRDFLGDPEATTARVKQAAIAYELARSDAAVAAQDVAAAQAHLGRVLALDEGNLEALRRLERLGRSKDLKRRILVGAGGLLVLLGLAVLAIVFVDPPSPGSARARRPDGGAGAASASDPRARLPDAGGRPSATALEDGGGLVRSDASADAGVASGEADSGPVRDAARGDASPAAGRRPPTATGPRLVVFQPSPQNVQIAVDEGPLRPFGPSFRSAELPLGRHRLRIVPGTDCCESWEGSFTVEAGDGPQVVARSLAYRPARFYVAANVPADVVVRVPEQAPVSGRSRELVRVPLRAPEATARFSVTAPGYRDYTGRVLLRTGQVVEESVTLVPEAPAP
ncbi:MAG: protein kinase [Polyangiales bacterium]